MLFRAKNQSDLTGSTNIRNYDYLLSSQINIYLDQILDSLSIVVIKIIDE